MRQAEYGCGATRRDDHDDLIPAGTYIRLIESQCTNSTKGIMICDIKNGSWLLLIHLVNERQY
jgi:hypothetical protein